ncbi:MAG: hypothetical protein ACK5XQ_13850 [Flavobacteriales bacterium]|jgi:hypothetical protein
MDLPSEKLALVRMLLNTNDEQVIAHVRSILMSHSAHAGRPDADTYNKELDQSLLEFKEGKAIPYEQVKRQFGR